MMLRLSVWFWLILPSLLHAQAKATIPDPDPELERKSFIVADGFEVNLFAADPLLAKPIQMNFDPQGRLWIASSEVYPQIKPGEKANDKIIILEDTDGDGKADKTSVFADGLLIPTGVEPGDGGAYVANSTELLHLSSSQRTGKADRSRVVLSGFGTEDTHHILHTFRWGPDGMLYMNQSIYIHSHVETPRGVRRLNAGGIWQFRPETMDLNVFVRGFINSWGHHFDRWGQSFITDGANGEGINHGIPGAYYPTAIGSNRILHGLNPGSPKHCGLEVVSGRHLPDDWQGNLLTNDFRGHRVCRFVLKDDGSTYASREMPELIKTNHAAFRPIDIKMGPDGAIYIADWYNPIIQHGEIDFRDPRRDHTHGRIWRVTAKNRKLVPRPELVKATTAELLEHLKAPEDWTRHQAKRVLKERGAKEVLPALDVWWKKLDTNDKDYEHHLLEALWTYQSLDRTESTLLKAVLNAKDYRARAAATRVLASWHSRLPDALELLSERINDENPRVRMEAVRSLSALQTAQAAIVAMRILDKPMDKILDYAAWLTARELEPKWMPAFREGTIDFGGNAQHLTFALQSVGSAFAIQPLMQLLKSGKVAKEREDAVWALVAQLGGAAELRAVFDRARGSELTMLQRVRLLEILEETARHRQLKPTGDLNTLKELLDSEAEALKVVSARLAGTWKTETLRDALIDLVKGDKTSLTVRRAAFDGLVGLGGSATLQLFEQLADEPTPAETRRLAIVALTAINLDAAAKKAVAFLRTVPPSDELMELYASFLQRKGGAVVLGKALAMAELKPDIAKLGIRAVRSSVQDAPSLIDALTKAGKLTDVRREMKKEELEVFVGDVLKTGSAVRGEAIYRRKEMQCLSCHAIQGAGGLVGPDLGSIGASAPIDYLVESLLLPNKAVKEGYHAVKITLLDGKVYSGIKTRESKTELVIRTADDKEIIIPTKDIDERINTRSLMPDGLVDTLTRAELVDLVRFLSELGKVGPYSQSKARIVRRWQTFQPTPEGTNYLRRNRVGAAAENHPAVTWASAYSTVTGDLPLADVPSIRIWKDTAELAIVRAQFDVTAPGKIKLKFNSAAGLNLWINATPIDAKEELIVDMPAGIVNLMISVDRSLRKEPLRCEIEDLPDSAARVSILGGK